MTKPTGMVMAAGADDAAALIGLAPAATADGPDPFQLLFGDSGINTWTPTADTDLAALSPTLASDFATSVDSFDASASGGSIPFIDGDSPFRGLLDHFDPSALPWSARITFSFRTTPLVTSPRARITRYLPAAGRTWTWTSSPSKLMFSTGGSD